MSAVMRQTLYLQWKASRYALLPFVLISFALPLVAVRSAVGGAPAASPWRSYEVLSVLQIWTPLFPLLAGLVGVTVALAAWNWDHKVNHVYALSLPVSRSEYALLKLGGGGAALLVPVLALLVGSLLATSFATIPEGLHAYPFALTLRFLVAALIAYAAAFALASGTVRTTVRVIVGVLLFVIFGTLLVGFLEQALARSDLWTPLDVLDAALVRWPGPFNVYGGSWMLIDV